jgi:hypothetical protein
LLFAANIKTEYKRNEKKKLLEREVRLLFAANREKGYNQKNKKRKFLEGKIG